MRRSSAPQLPQGISKSPYLARASRWAFFRRRRTCLLGFPIRFLRFTARLKRCMGEKIDGSSPKVKVRAVPAWVLHPGRLPLRSNGKRMAQGPLPSDDGGLVAAFRAGRGAAFDAIVARHYAGMLRVAEQRCGSSALADDAVQTALVRAHRYLRGSGPVENVGAWLRRVVFNCATDLLRTERHGAELTEEVPAVESDGAEGKELRQILADAILRLPEVYREPLMMRYLHGLEAREIAEQLKDNVHSVKSRIARGRHELRLRVGGLLRRSGYL